MAAIGICDAHGYFDGEECPDCGAEGRHVLSDDRRRRLSKFVSGLLRHFPDDYDLAVDARGWADTDRLVEIVDQRYDWADRRGIEAVVAVDPKGRFEIDGKRIRAAYGHSIDITLEDTAGPIPDVLYHGTAPATVDAILAEGLRPMNRQLVHLSGTVADARAVGARHADDPVVLVVDAAGMLADGHRITERGTSVYATDYVPPDYIHRRE